LAPARRTIDVSRAEAARAELAADERDVCVALGTRTEPQCQEGDILPATVLGLQDLLSDREDHLVLSVTEEGGEVSALLHGRRLQPTDDALCC
jgi:hypothetical protein